MKLNKPKVTDNQSELESYVESLLKDNVELVATIDSKVTPLRSKKARLESKSETAKVSSEAINQSLVKSDLVKSDLVDDALAANPGKNEVVDRLSNLPDNQPLPSESSKSRTLEPNQVESTKASDPVDSDIAEPAKSKVAERSAIEPPMTPRKPVKESLTPADAVQQHHEKITKEFKAYQESAHSHVPEPDPRLKNVEKLLSRIALASVVTADHKTELKTATEALTDTQLKPDADQHESQAVTAEVAEASFLHRDAKPMKELLGDVFQTLVFEVHKLPLAVPLVKLGGIVNFSEEEVTPLVGTPDWFLGLVPNERGNLMVVDTQKFIMPEKTPSEPKEYEYLIVLDNSNWALACHAVNDAKNLSPDDIRWSARSSKRPWFAGMVVEYMSALVEVDELINMLAENVVE